jgi:DNA-binding transcriptional MerR regulator
MGAHLRIGKLAKVSGLTIKTIRYYEARGLLPAPPRTEAGYRFYSEADLHRLEFIKQAKALGLTLEQIRELAVASRERACAMTRPLLLKRLDERINQTAQQILTLKRLKRELEHRQETPARRPPTDHGRGYCGCLEDGKPVAHRIVKIAVRTSA